MYFDIQLLHTQCFDHQYQACHVTDVENNKDHCIQLFIYMIVKWISMSSLARKIKNGNQYVPVKYDLSYMMEEHVGHNPLH